MLLLQLLAPGLQKEPWVLVPVGRGRAGEGGGHPQTAGRPDTCSSSQYMAFFEFNNRLEAILSKAYVYR